LRLSNHYCGKGKRRTSLLALDHFLDQKSDINDPVPFFCLFNHCKDSRMESPASSFPNLCRDHFVRQQRAIPMIQ
jgi:hypothetical protein